MDPILDKKFELIGDYMAELKPILDFEDKEIIADPLKLHTSERLLQLIADEMVSINEYLIKKNNFSVPDDFYSTFITLGENGILPRDFALKLAPIVGLRNRLVHQYEEVDNHRFIRTLKNNFDDFGQYLKYIREALD